MQTLRLVCEILREVLSVITRVVLIGAVVVLCIVALKTVDYQKTQTALQNTTMHRIGDIIGTVQDYDAKHRNMIMAFENYSEIANEALFEYQTRDRKKRQLWVVRPETYR